MSSKSINALPEGIRAVTLDVGGTLIEPWPSVGQIYAEAAGECGMTDLTAEALEKQFKQAWSARTAQAPFDYSRDAWQELVNRTFAGVAAPLPTQECFERIYERFAQPHAWRVFPDVAVTLELLRHRGLRLGVISNWDERLSPLLERLNLAQWFQVIMVSHEAKHPKPHPAIFAQAAARLDLPPDKILHVGDSMEEDVTGARSSGFQAALIDRSRRADPETGIRLHSLLLLGEPGALLS